MYTIYRLESPSGKQYIGYTAGDVQKRFAEHVRDSTRENCQYRKIARAIKKYNPQNWKIEIIDTYSLREDALAAECAMIEEHDTFTNGYNMTRGGDGVDSETASQIKQAYWDSERSEKQRKENSDRFKNNNPGADWTGRKHSEESKRKISEAKTGTKASDETKIKMSESKKAAWASGAFDNRPPMTDEHKEKIRLAQIGKKQPQSQKDKVAKANSATWDVVSPEGEHMVVENLRAFCRERGLDQSNLCRGSHKKWKAQKRGPEGPQ